MISKEKPSEHPCIVLTGGRKVNQRNMRGSSSPSGWSGKSPQEGNLNSVLKDEDGHRPGHSSALCLPDLTLMFPSHLLSNLGIAAVSNCEEMHSAAVLHSSCVSFIYLKTCSFFSMKTLQAGEIVGTATLAVEKMSWYTLQMTISLLKVRSLVLKTQNLTSQWFLSHGSSFRLLTWIPS